MAADDVHGLVRLARERGADLVVVGPEAPLVAGLADRLHAVGVPVMGPTAAAARIEGSKAWAKAFMARYGIPTAAARSFAADERDAAHAYVEAHPLPVVLKADGLAAGKGVVIAATRADAHAALDDILGGAFGEAGARVVVEEHMEGEEASVFALCDGADFALLAPAQDHKRIGDGDTGPNTGGMGAYAPAPVVTPEVIARVEAEIIRPVLDGMAAEGHPYRGVLYAGLMLTPGGARVVEFNCRLGDPETQAVLPLLDSDVLELFEAVADGRLREVDARTGAGAAACVVLAAPGYPGPVRTGDAVRGLADVPPDVLVFHAGTAAAGGELVTAGGRVLGVVGRGADLRGALDRAYAGVEALQFEGMQLRRDIGRRGLERGA